jgi:hypothetical protein
VIRFLSSDGWSGSWSGIPWEGRTAQATMGRMHTSIAAVRIRGSPDFSAFPTLHRFKKVRVPLVPGRNNVKAALRYLRFECSDRLASWSSLGCASQGKATSRYLHSGERRHHQQWQDHISSEIGKIQYVISESSRHSFKP